MIGQMVVPNHASKGMWSVIIATKRDILMRTQNIH